MYEFKILIKNKLLFFFFSNQNIDISSIHSFLMFAPVLIIDDLFTTISGIFLFITGPLLSMTITDNIHEQASIWCFFSISQIIIIVSSFIIKVHMFGDEQEKKDYTTWMPTKFNYEEKYPGVNGSSKKPKKSNKKKN
eukprot:TRINITY_DN420_c0_g1_i3.p2 TRINITY_DN420_c0_g1~~TRINITY_DN420_c0_g1_i3.p2  ORF type:complete len:137 (+),score=20.75 TRINITY_DN420_c0_g1_i3:1022-1432(+)